MFREQYIRDNEKLHAKETLLMEIKKKAAEERSASVRRAKFVRYGAVAAAFVLVLGGVLGTVLISRPLAAKTAESAVASVASASADKATGNGETDAFASYDELYDAIKAMNGGDATAVSTDMAVAEEVEAPAPAAGSGATVTSDAAMDEPRAASSCSDYSETNVQVKGVDEADIVKTDGTYIYYLAENTLSIAKADGKDTTVLSRTNVYTDDGNWGYAAELFLLGNRLMIVCQSMQTVWVNDQSTRYQSGANQTEAIIYDVSNREKPALVVSLGQSGSYVSSRLIGEYVYLVTSHTVYNCARSEPATYVPALTENGASELLDAGAIMSVPNPTESAYTVVGSINLKSGARHASAKAVFGGTSTIYAATDRLLLALNEYDSETLPIAPDKDGKNVQITTGESKTKLVLLSLDGERIEKLASGTVSGGLINQFSMDIYQNVVRLVTTVSKWEERIYTDGVDTYEYEDASYNCLYTLDESLNPLGKLEKLAEDEWVESVRFDGGVGYFVTFRQVDPLFTVDLSNPKAPRVLSTLKIPGFSEYLHVFSKNRLLGIGYQADEKSGRTEGVKLSMFDTTNKSDVTEKATASVDASWSIAGSNHKSILVNAEKNLIAFPADESYFIYRYFEDTGFTLAAKVRVGAGLWNANLRGLFIGDELYVLTGESIVILSMTDFTVLTEVKLA